MIFFYEIDIKKSFLLNFFVCMYFMRDCRLFASFRFKNRNVFLLDSVISSEKKNEIFFKPFSILNVWPFICRKT